MKNSIKYLVTLLFTLLSYASYAQIGVTGSIGISDLFVRDNNTIGTIYAGFSGQVGGSFEIELGDVVSLVPGLRFSYNSARDIDLDKIKSMYLNIPVDAKIYFTDVGDNRLYAIGGGYFGYMLSAKINTTRLTIGNTLEDDQVPFDAGFRIGAGIKLFETLSLDIVSDIGFINIDGGSHTNGYREMNRTFRVTATYQF